MNECVLHLLSRTPIECRNRDKKDRLYGDGYKDKSILEHGECHASYDSRRRETARAHELRDERPGLLAELYCARCVSVR